MNDESNVQCHRGKLSIQVNASDDTHWGGGTYSLTVNPDNSNITLQSMLSGSYSYVYNVSGAEWVGSEDGHSLLGMLMRDWIRQCQGVPDF